MKNYYVIIGDDKHVFNSKSSAYQYDFTTNPEHYWSQLSTFARCKSIVYTLTYSDLTIEQKQVVQYKEMII